MLATKSALVLLATLLILSCAQAHPMPEEKKTNDEAPMTKTVAAPSAFDNKIASLDLQIKEAIAELTRKHPKHPEGTINISDTGLGPFAVPRPGARYEPYPMPHGTPLTRPGAYGIPGPYGLLGSYRMPRPYGIPVTPPALVPFAGPVPYATSNARPLFHMFFTVDEDFMVEMGLKMPAEEFMDVYQEMIRLFKGRKPNFILAKPSVPFDDSTDLHAVNPPPTIPTSSLNKPKSVLPTTSNQVPTPQFILAQPVVSIDAKTPKERESVNLAGPA